MPFYIQNNTNRSRYLHFSKSNVIHLAPHGEPGSVKLVDGELETDKQMTALIDGGSVIRISVDNYVNKTLSTAASLSEKRKEDRTALLQEVGGQKDEVVFADCAICGREISTRESKSSERLLCGRCRTLEKVSSPIPVTFVQEFASELPATPKTVKAVTVTDEVEPEDIIPQVAEEIDNKVKTTKKRRTVKPKTDKVADKE